MATHGARTRRRGRLEARVPEGRSGDLAPFVAVPVILSSLDAITRALRSKPTEFLLVPPLAVVVYLLFSQPGTSDGRLRSVVLLPLIASFLGEFGYRLLGLTPWGIAAVALGILAAQRGLGARMPPALAVGVLAMLLRVEDSWYAVDVGIATLLIWLAFLGWCHLRGTRQRGSGSDGDGPRVTTMGEPRPHRERTHAPAAGT